MRGSWTKSKLSYKLEGGKKMESGTTFREEVHISHQHGDVVDRKKLQHQVRNQVSLMVKNKETYSDGHIMLKKTAWSHTVIHAAEVAKSQQGHTADDDTPFEI